MWEKEKISKSLSIGLVSLVFIFLSLQFLLFVAKVVEIRKYNKAASEIAQNQTQEVEILPAATENRENQTLEVADTLPKGNSSVKSSRPPVNVAKTFSLEKLPPRPAYKPRPKVELNSADTTALKTLYGIGSYYARKIVEFRERLGGSFASPEQLMDIYGIDSVRFVGFADRVYIDTALIVPLDLYHMPLDSMANHPYIGKYAARGIERYRRTVDSTTFSLDTILKLGILRSPYVQRLKMYQ